MQLKNQLISYANRIKTKHLSKLTREKKSANFDHARKKKVADRKFVRLDKRKPHT